VSRNKTKLFVVTALILVVTVLISFFILQNKHNSNLSSITGLSVFHQNKEEQISNPEINDSTEENPFVPLNINQNNNSIINKTENTTANSISNNNRGQAARGGGNAEENLPEPLQGFRVFDLAENLSLYLDGKRVIVSDKFNGKKRFELQNNGVIISKFDIIFSQDINLSRIIAVSSEDRSFIYDPLDTLKNIELYIPRSSQDLQVRVCKNISSIENLQEGCAEEELLGPTSETLSVTSDGLFFILNNTKSVGGISERGEFQQGINLLIPFLNSGFTSRNATFQYLLANDKEMSNCTLYIKNSIASFISNPKTNQVQEFQINSLDLGKNSWKIICSDIENNVLESEERSLTIFKPSAYGGKTTNLASVQNMKKVFGFTLEKQRYGLINFEEPVDLSEGIDFDSIVSVGYNFISINSELAPQLNVPAKLTFYGINFKDPVILRDGKVCEDCEIISNDGDLTFRVSHFSSYTSSENSQLRIYDSTDSSKKYIDQDVEFFANYTKTADNSPIQGGGTYCNITFPDTETEDMTYNSTLGLYTFNRTFGSGGTFLFSVSCYGTPLTVVNLNSSDLYTIYPQSSNGINGATVTPGTSSSAPADPAGNATAFAGNITEVTITGSSTTQTWQGFYGNVSGTIELGDANNRTMYNWTLTSPEGEVYASTNDILMWTNIQCFNFTASGTYGDESGDGGTTNLNGTNLAILENTFGIGSTDADGVNETFSEKNHNGFYTAGKEFSQNECQSMHVFTNSGPADGKFEEVLLYEPVTSGVVFASLLEKDLTGFDRAAHDFEMLVLENGHNGDVATTSYYFFVEVE
jgi:hypothetical protein